MTSKLRIAALGSWLTLATIAGCATAPPPAPGTVTSPIPGREAEPVKPKPAASPGNTAAVPVPVPTPGTAVGTTASGGTIVRIGPSVAPRDSTPSRDAQAVLQTIPEPVPGASSAPGSGGSETTSAPSASNPEVVAHADTSGAPDTTFAEVPIPAPTQPLGDRPGARALTDSATVTGPPGTAQAGGPAGAGGGAPAAAAPSDSCWRVQVVAVPEAARAEALRDAAQSQLWTTMVIETEKKLHKVRTKDCLTAAAAERLKQHAIATGFKGAFRFLPPK